jgi:hypothetical protein
MAFRAPRRQVVALLIAMLLGISTIAHGFVMTEAALKMSAATGAMDMPSPDHAVDCGGDDKAARAACMATCASIIAILCESAQMPIVATMQDLAPDVELPFSGRGIPPEPHPPKPAVLI